MQLNQDAEKFVVVEAKMFSKLSKGTKHAAAYNQAARSVACMALLVADTGRSPQQIPSLAFFVAAPQAQLDAGAFAGLMEKESLEAVVRQRVDCLAWESVLAFIKSVDMAYGAELEDFYRRCLAFGRRAVVAGRR